MGKLQILIVMLVLIAFSSTTASAESIPDHGVGGGDTIETATSIEIPFAGAGCTAGFGDDYGESCPYPDWSPDVVYTFTMDVDELLSIDMYGSQYDTKVYVYQAGDPMELVACNDLYYPDETSRIHVMEVEAAEQYYIIVDGSGYQDAGDYVIRVELYEDIVLNCGGHDEGEPPLVDGYIDEYNGGCSSGGVMQTLLGEADGTTALSGRTGWYLRDGNSTPDVDWFEVTVGMDGVVDVVLTGELETILYHVGPLDCGSAGVLQDTFCHYGEAATMSITGEPGQVIWLLVRPWWWSEPPPWQLEQEYGYCLELQGVESSSTAVVRKSLTEVKELFR